MTTSKPVFLCDVDGVLGDFTTAILKASGSSFTSEDIKEYDVWKYFKQEAKQSARGQKAVTKPEFWAGIQPYPGASLFIENLKYMGFDVVMLTSPWWGCVGWDYTRREWLSKHFGIHPQNVLIGHRKELVHGQYFLDDKPEHVKSWNAWRLRHPSGLPFGLLFDRPYNRDETEDGVDLFFRERMLSYQHVLDRIEVDRMSIFQEEMLMEFD